MADHPKISKEAEALIDAVLSATAEESGEAMHNLHRYIEKLEKRRAPHTKESERHD